MELGKFSFDEFAFGYTNQCINGSYVLFLDFDNVFPSYVYDNIKKVQKKFKLSDFYVFQSSANGYHAVCFDKVGYELLVKIMWYADVDEYFIVVPEEHKKHWILRLSRKDGIPVIFTSKQPSPHKNYEKSNAHRILLNNLFSLDIAKDECFDSETKLHGAFYPLKKYLYKNARMGFRVFDPAGNEIENPVLYSNNPEWDYRIRKAIEEAEGGNQNGKETIKTN